MNINSIKLNNVQMPNGTERQIPFGSNKVQNSKTNTQSGEDKVEFKNNFEGGNAKLANSKGMRKFFYKVEKLVKDFVKLDTNFNDIYPYTGGSYYNYLA